ncbi:hypothetical protein [Parabacteroides sp.]
MIYTLLQDMRKYLLTKQILTEEEQKIFVQLNKSLSVVIKNDDSELLTSNEVLVRISRATKHPVLVCYNGDGTCFSLHNETVEEDGLEIEQWLQVQGKMCVGSRKLLEAVADISYNAGVQHLCDNENSREVVMNLIDWAREFEKIHAETDWDEKDYMIEIESFYNDKIRKEYPKELHAFTDFGDFVRCNNCGKTMLLPIGAEICPSCDTEGYLAWVDDEHQEVSCEKLKSEYQIIPEDDLPPEEYLTQETLQEGQMT